MKKTYDMEISNTNNNSHIRLEVISPKILLTELVRLNAALKVVDDNVSDDINDNVNIDAVEVPFNRNRNTNVSARSRKLRSSRIFIKKETTEDRIVFAEALRLELEQQHPPRNRPEYAINTCAVSPAQAYVMHKHRNNNSPTFASTSSNLISPNEIANDTVLKNLPPVFVSQPETLRLVVVSDTHGFEDQLTSPLPDGDVLLHLGDFAMDTIVMNTAGGNKSRRSRHDNSQLKNFDAWLAKQSARMKIVVRGNHDPRSMAFVQSGATYVTQPTIMDIGGYKFAFVPYQSATKNGLRHKGTIPKTGCDVIVSHVPPYSILDRCHTGKLAGSNTLLKGAQSINGKDGPPLLWLCGHIHESRGIVHDVVLTKNKSKDVAATSTTAATNTIAAIGTTIINAACANLGRANYIEYGPTVLDLGDKNLLRVQVSSDNLKVNGDNGNINTNHKNNKKINIIQMDGRYEYMNSKHPYFFCRDDTNDDPGDRHSTTSPLLLAIDLGLRTGISLFDGANNGRLLRYDHFDYDSVDALKIGAVQLLQDWDMEANLKTNPSNSSNDIRMYKQITHVAIEGSDPPLIDAWKQAIRQRNENLNHDGNTDESNSLPSPTRVSTKLLLVSPNEWRTDLLTRVERETGESAKLASRRIAQWIIKEHTIVDSTDCNMVHDSAVSTSSSPSSGTVGMDISTDVAESILLGYHITRRLGWCDVYNK